MKGFSFARAAAALVAVASIGCFDDPLRPEPGRSPGVLTGDISTDRTLYADTTYTLSGFVKVRAGATLFIQPGTRIVGDTTIPGSSLWIVRGAKIQANGTADRPIVFTSARTEGRARPGDWGGIVMVGNARINRSGSQAMTEGAAGNIAENYAGGTDDNDDSGTLRYVRIEYAGFDLSGAGGEEMNALTLYAVGRGTTLEYVQVLQGLDDSFEFFGGAVDGRYLVSYEAGDDHFDWTEGYRGRLQFLVAYQSGVLTPRPGAGLFSVDPRFFEGDGCDPKVSGCTLASENASTPYSSPTVSNFTLVGPGASAAYPTESQGIYLRRGTAGYFANGIVAETKGRALTIRDAFTNVQLGRDSLTVKGLLFAGVGEAFDPTAHASQFADSSKFGGSIRVLASRTGIVPANFDWTPPAGSPAASGAASVPAARVAGFFEGSWQHTTYVGAAPPAGAKWWQGWTRYEPPVR